MNLRRAVLVALLIPVAACSKPAGGEPGKAGASGGQAAGSGGQAVGRSGGQGGARPAAPVEVAEAKLQRVEDIISGTGQIEPIQSIELRPEVEGRITEILFNEGAMVARNAPLFKVDDAELRAGVAQAEANRDLAAQALARTRQLMESQGATQSDLERAEAQARGSQAALDILKVRLERTTVRAPFAGVTGARTVSIGDFVNSQSRLVTLQTVNPQRATLAVPERYAERLRLGQQISFTVAALGNRAFTGTVDFVDPVVRLPGRTILVKARVANPRRELSSGMFVEGRLIAAARDSAIVIPEDAILPVEGSAVVWVIKDDKAERRDVELGIRTPGFVEVIRGVEAGEHVVVGGAERLAPGAPVRPTLVERRP